MIGLSGGIKLRIIVAAAVLAVAASAAGAWYFLKYASSPDYALAKLEEAVEKHDKDQFYKYADVEHLLDTASNVMIEGLVDSTVPVSADAKAAVGSFARMFKDPVVMSMQRALDNYIMYGNWKSMEISRDANSFDVDSDMVVSRMGVAEISFKRIDSLAIDDENGTAVAKAVVHHSEADEDFTLDVELIQSEEGHWKLYEITNLQDYVKFVNMSRQKKVKAYFDEVTEIIAAHEASIKDIDSKLNELLLSGSLGSNETRESIKKIMNEELVPDWRNRKTELEAVSVPPSVASLHRLQLKICDLRIAYGESYARWMDDKKAASIRNAENSLKQAKTLEKEAELLTKQAHAHAL